MIPWQVLQRFGDGVVAACDVVDAVINRVSPVQSEAVRRSNAFFEGLQTLEEQQECLEPGELRHRFYWGLICNESNGGSHCQRSQPITHE